MSPDLVFRDPYILDFLGLADTYSEQDLEEAILRELESFILELGDGFAFVARQKRITIDGTDYRLDLLFFHRKLRRLVALDLKLGTFEAADKGQMELYLRWLEDNEMQPGEESPLGLILCAGKSDEHVELLRLHESGIRVAAYLTDLPPRALLQKKLHEAVRAARTGWRPTMCRNEILQTLSAQFVAAPKPIVGSESRHCLHTVETIRIDAMRPAHITRSAAQA